jgi:hypothetical protein
MNKNHKSYSYSLLSTALAGITLVILLVALHGINTEAAPLRGPGTGDDPEIRFVTMTSDLPHYDPRDGEGITKTVYFSNEVAGTITMTFDITGTPMLSLTAGAAFEQGERVYTSSTEPLTQPVTYTVGTGGTQPNIGYTTTNTDGVTTTVAISYVQDITAPMVSINSPAAGSVLTTAHQPTVTIDGTASDDPSGLSEVRVTTGTTWAEADGLGDWDYTWTLPITDNIEYGLKAQAIDNADNVSTTTEVSVTVDTVAPTATAPVPHTSPWVTSTVVYTWAESSDGAGIAGYRVRITNTEGYEVISSTDESVLTFTEALTEGAGYYARARAIDNNGNVGMWSDPSDVVTPDLTPPTISQPSIVETSAHLYVLDLHLYYTNTMPVDQTFAVKGESTDALSGLERVSFSPAFGTSPADEKTSFSPWQSEAYDVSAGTTGSGIITATVYDNVGNTAVQTYTYALDSKPPTSTASSPDCVTSGSIDVTWNATDTQSGIYSTTLWYKKEDAGAWTSYDTKNADSGTFNFVPNSDGTYLFSTVAADNLGNLEGGRTVSETWTVYATEVPQADVTDTPAYENSSPITVTWEVTPSLGTIEEVRLWYRYKKGDWVSTTLTSTQQTGTGQFAFKRATDGSDDGTYDFAVVARDEYGKSDGEPSGDNGVEGTTIYDTHIDSVDALTADPADWSNTNAFTVTWNNPVDLSDIAGVRYSIDATPTDNQSGTFEAGQDIKTLTGLTVPDEGEHTIWIWLKDNTGNIDYTTAQTTTLHYDASIDEPNNLKATPAKWTNNNDFTLTWTNPPDDSGIAKAYYKLDDAPSGPEDYDGQGDPNEISNIQVNEDGEHNVYVWLEDNAGNVDTNAATKTSLRYDATDPTNVTITAPEHISETTFTVSWSAEDATSGVAYYTLKYSSTATSGWERWGDTYTDTTQTTFDGAEAETDYTFRVTAYDEAGNSSDDVTTTYVGAFNIYLPLTVRNYAPFCPGYFDGDFGCWPADKGPFLWQGNEWGSGLSYSIVNNQARLGNPNYKNDAIPVGYAHIAQTFTVPDDATRLSLRYRVISDDTIWGEKTKNYFDTFEVSINEHPKNISEEERDSRGCRSSRLNPADGEKYTPDAQGLVFCSGQAPTDEPQEGWDSGWRTISLDLSNFSGQNITLHITTWNREYEHPWRNDRGYFNTYAYVDNITLE